MFCTKCGALNQDDAAFCNACGAPLQESQNAGSSMNMQNMQNMQYGSYNLNNENQYPMKWFKFLIYFALFAGAVMNAVMAVQYLTGSIYGSDADADLVYEVYGALGYNLKSYDTIIGVMLILIAVFGIFTRFRLAGYKKDGPMCLYIMYIVNAAATVLYVLLVSSMLESVSESANVTVDTDTVTSSAVSSVIVCVIMLAVNITYFKKRKSFFVK